MSSYTTQKAAIVSILQTNITTAREVNNYAKRNPAGYPAINVENFDGSGAFADTGRNRRKRIYRITCMQERLKVGTSEAERILAAMVDQIITTFDNRANLNLNNTADFAYPIPSKWGYIQAPDIDVRTAEILLEADSLE
jgi:hypothetical protein